MSKPYTNLFFILTQKTASLKKAVLKIDRKLYHNLFIKRIT
ncbi:hypothetical protein JCM19301_3620 [Jejuia pallidilutea]|uniref:Uncharacterized protein n=1 Tax=Jejuia pallidilutea TaxID=504487 RepID=A0A090VME1_9FLAO|nr:hypothetical protein JCM19301_3620 [Jejuia pallidilutea]